LRKCGSRLQRDRSCPLYPPGRTGHKMTRRNLELKAWHANLAAARAAALALGARPGGIELQVDTYFRVPHGRLKLREIEGQTAVLIWYARPDATGARTSDYHLVPAPDPGTLKAALAAALGVRGVVRKRRDIFHWHNVRIHLDEVDGLGTFVEFEAVLSAEESETAAQPRLAELMRALGIRPEDQRGASYADLLGF